MCAHPPGFLLRGAGRGLAPSSPTSASRRCYRNPKDGDAWDGEIGFVHEAVDRFLRVGDLDGEPDAYLCGPPPMVDATIELHTDVHHLDEGHIF